MSSSSTAVKGWTQVCARALSSLSWIFLLPVPNVLSKLTLERHPSFLTCTALTTVPSSATPFHVCNLIYWDLKTNRKTVDSLTSTDRASPRDYPQWMPSPAHHESYDVYPNNHTASFPSSSPTSSKPVCRVSPFWENQWYQDDHVLKLFWTTQLRPSPFWTIHLIS